MNLKNKKVLITGSEGFIGSHLVERFLKEDCEIKAFVYYNAFNSRGWLDSLPEESIEKLEIFLGDIRDPYAVREAVKDVDIICHLAALIGIPYSYVAPESYINTNVLGTSNLLQAAKDFNTEKIIITSTSETYGTALYTPIDEKHPYQPQSPYSASKIAADNIALSFFYSFNLPVSIIRPFNTFGPRQSTRAIIPTIITQILKNQEELKLGNLNPTRDLTFVLDTCDAYIKLCKKDNLEGEIINIGNSSEISIGDLANMIKNLMNSEIKIVSEGIRARPEKSEVNRLLANITKARKLLGWEPKCNLTEGLTLTIEWFKKKENLEKYKLGYNI
ncbi:MAG: SDR family NAD(P)-dependent oxidoreductase [Candidatus Lokiarchaeota archaeon]|nr:SDR family NAD(P)-dependent oxidoreductase [Candidatus Lokiarchaeota archaeon]